MLMGVRMGYWVSHSVAVKYMIGVARAVAGRMSLMYPLVRSAVRPVTEAPRTFRMLISRRRTLASKRAMPKTPRQEIQRAMAANMPNTRPK